MYFQKPAKKVDRTTFHPFCAALYFKLSAYLPTYRSVPFRFLSLPFPSVPAVNLPAHLVGVRFYFFIGRRDSWDPSLMFVLGFGVMTSLVGFPLVTRKLGTPLCRAPAKAAENDPTAAPLAEKFEIPTSTEVLYAGK